MKCEFPSPCWFAINVQNVSMTYAPIYSSEEVETSPTYLDTTNMYWDILYQGWKNKPEIKSWWSKSPIGLILNAVEETINVQVEVLNDIRHGKYTGQNMYDSVERDRVETIGFKPIYSPGGFVI
jgi:hypothetical protein